MFYKKRNGHLYFQASAKEFCLDNKEHTISFERKGNKNVFIIFKDNNIVFKNEYISWQFDPLNKIDPNFNDDMEENQDLFLFIYNVINDDVRYKRIYS